MSDLWPEKRSSTPRVPDREQASLGQLGDPGTNTLAESKFKSFPNLPSQRSLTKATRTVHDGHRSVGATVSTKPRSGNNLDRASTLPSDTYPADSNCPPAIGRYQILQRIGGGAMGVVYSAYDPSLQRRVAIKLMRRSDSSRNLARFVQEAQLMARLSHPNVVQVFEAGQNQDRAYLAMELIEGLTLGDWLNQRIRSHREILDVFVQIGHGLHAAHCAGVIHRDFKPDNIFVGIDGRARVGDFGVARLTDRSADRNKATTQGIASHPVPPPQMTAHGEIIGTPAYMAPEQLLGQEVDARSDQFAFCVALYESLYGKRPFAAQSPERLAALLLDQKELWVRFPNKQDPSWIRSSLKKGLALTPETRFDSMVPLLAELQRRPKPRWPMAIGGSALALITWLAVDRSNQLDESICPADISILKGIWDPPTRSQVRESILAYDLPYRIALADHVEEQLDGYSNRIIEGQVESCRATHIQHVQSELLLDRRKHCLSDRLRSLRALTLRLQNQAGFELEQIEKNLDALPNPNYCGLAEFSGESWAPPASEAVALQVENIRKQLAELFSLPSQTAIVQAKQLIQEANQIKFPPLIAETWFALGRIHHEAHNLDAAVEAFLQAVDHAEASGHDELTWRGWIQLTKIANHERINLVEAENWLRRSEALCRRLGNPDQMAADVLEQKGSLAIHQGRVQKAIDVFEQAFKLLESSEASPVRIADTFVHLANAYYKKSQNSHRAQFNYNRALVVYESYLGPSHPLVARTLLAVGASNKSQQKLKQAEDVYRRALDILIDAPDTDHKLLSHVYLELAGIASGKGNCSLAYDYLAKSRIQSKIASDTPGTLTARYYEQLAVCRLQDNLPSLARQDLLNALAIMENPANRSHQSYLQVLYNLGTIELRNNQIEPAKHHFRQAIVAARSSDNPDSFFARHAKRGYASALFSEGETNQATNLLEEVLRDILDDNSATVEDVASLEWQMSQSYYYAETDFGRAIELANRSRYRFALQGAEKHESMIQEIDNWMTTNESKLSKGEKQ